MQTTTKTILATIAASALLAPAASADRAPAKARARCQADITKAVRKDGKPKDKGSASSVVLFGMRIVIVDTDGDKKPDVVLIDVNNDGTWDGGAFDCDHDGTLEQRWEDLNHNGEPDLGEVTPAPQSTPKAKRDSNRDQQVRVGVGRCAVKVTLKPRGVRARRVAKNCASQPAAPAANPPAAPAGPSAPPAPPPGPPAIGPVTQADIDGDGDIDVVIVGRKS